MKRARRVGIGVSVVLGGLLLGPARTARAAAAAPDLAVAAPAGPRVSVFAMVIRSLADGRAAAAFDADVARGYDPVLVEVPTRLRLELAAAGLLEPDDTHAPDYVVTILREHDGGPLVAELRSVGPRATSRRVRREQLVASVTSDAASVAAIRTVEFVRATILQDEVAARPPPAQVDQEEPRPRGRPFVVGFAVTAFQSFRGIDTGLGVGGHLGVALSGPLSLRVMSSVSAFARDQDVSGGSVSMMQIVLGAGVAYALGDFHGIRPALSAMAGGYLASIASHPTIGLTTSGDGVAPFAGLGLGLPLVSWGGSSSLRLQVDALFTRPARVFDDRGNEAGRTGNPLLLIGVSIDRRAELRHDGGR